MRDAGAGRAARRGVGRVVGAAATDQQGEGGDGGGSEGANG
jgi:hypothetical protein